jgi:CrcB protein
MSIGAAGTHAVLVGTGGFVGAILRYAVSGIVQRMAGSSDFPYGTLAVNVCGCLAIGFLAGVAETRQIIDAEARMFLLIGVLGSFTTFSTFGHETLALLRDGALLRAGINVTLQVGLGLAAAWSGLVFSRLW